MTLNFSDLEIPKSVEPIKVQLLIKGRMVFGFDPLESDIETKKAGKPRNVFIIYDKVVMRTTTRIVTNKSFEQILNWYLGTEIDKNLFSTSYKFVKPNGSVRSLSEIRESHNIRNQQSQGDTTTLQS